MFAHILRRRQIMVVAILILGLTAACGSTAHGARTAPVIKPPAKPPSQQQQAQGTVTPTFTYVAIGASDAFGIGTHDPRTQSWPADLSHMIGGPVHLANLGIPSATADIAQRDEVPVALSLHPDLVTIWLGVNDVEDGVTLAAFRQQLQSILVSLKQGGVTAVYVGNLPDLTMLPFFDKRDPVALAQQVQSWNAAIKDLCSANGATLVDIFATRDQLALHPDYISSDGLHPSTVGAQKIAGYFADALQKQGQATPTPAPTGTP
jgi:acyl-CoA thioesterase I